MGQLTGGFRRPLGNAGVYSTLQRILGADRVRRSFVADHLKPQAGERVLDLGCGPGDILDLLPRVEYVGVDASPAYIAAARARFGSRHQFLCADVRELSLPASQRFDAVISIGVLHHLDDAVAAAMVGLAARALAPGGRLVTLDPGLANDQPRLARWLIQRDRGRNVRSADGYAALGDRSFRSVRVTVRHDLARVPYTHAMLECHEPIG